MFYEIPTVFAVEDTYQIMVKTEEKSVLWVKIGDRCFYDHSNGILKSDVDIHKVIVPSKLLDEAESYTVCYRVMKERKPYFSETSEIIEKTYEFHPVKGDKIRAYHISDAHNMVDEPVKAAEAYGKVDFLILNGDIPDHSGDVKNFDNIYEICAKITNGSIPVVFSRGNHDMRGVCAENLEDYTPTNNGKSYYTVKLGGFWALIMDCGEDKLDNSVEYGNTVCCHAFREEETDFIKNVVKDGKYLSDDIFSRAVICHVPFSYKFNPLFDIENDTYNEWINILNEDIKPNVMICGHTHKIDVKAPGESYRKTNFSVAVASELEHGKYFVGSGFEFSKNGGIKMTVTDSNGEKLKEYDI